MDDRVVGREGREQVGSADERQTGELGDPGRACVAESLRSVQAGADRGAADRELEEVGERLLDPLDVVVELRDVARELLSEA